MNRSSSIEISARCQRDHRAHGTASKTPRPDATSQPAGFCGFGHRFHELFFGAFKSARQAQNLRLLAAFRLEVVPFDGGDARQAGEIRAALVLGGTPIGPYDVLIAGQAVARDLVLVTRNTRAFQRVGGLVIEDWES